jgi:hypothetical protein
MTHPSRAISLIALIAGAVTTPVGGLVVGRACAAGDVHIAVVVDAGSSEAVSAVCVPSSSSDNGATILAARASMLGTPQPRFSSSGLLCSIDGLPATGCGEAHGGRYAYWSYWHGRGGNWSYSNFGPASSRVDSAIVEGWRWQPDGAGLPTDPPPRGPASAKAVCVPAPPPATAPPTTVATTTRPTPVTGISPPVGAQQTPSTAPSVGPRASTAASTATRPASRASTATTTATAGRHPPTRAPVQSSPSSFALAARGVAAGPPAHGSGTAPIGLIIGVSLVIALVAGGAIAARRRARTPS